MSQDLHTHLPDPQEGYLTKMGVSISETPSHQSHDQSTQEKSDIPSRCKAYIEYTLRMLSTHQRNDNTHPKPDMHVPLSPYLGREVLIEFLGKISCVTCGKTIKKTYGDGLCFPCFMEAPSAAECVLRPALCLAHEGKGRDVAWELENHAQPHLVYLALSNKYKVGVTRDWPTRWIDQGASAVHVIAETPYRQLAGQIEVFLTQHYSDRTSWQRMLKGENLEDADLEAEVLRARALLPPELSIYGEVDHSPLYFTYPMLEQINRVKSLKIEKIPSFKGRLIGARGQYLVFEGGTVLNMRAHTGYHARVSLVDSSLG